MPQVSSAPSRPGLPQTTLRVFGIHCVACAGILEAALVAVPGVTRARVAPASHRAVVRHAEDCPITALVAAVRRAGYDAVQVTGPQAEDARRHEARALLWRLFVAAFCAMQVMMMATPSYVATPGDLAPDLAALLNWGQWLVSMPVMIFSATPIFRQAASSLRLGRIGMDVPIALGLLVMFGASTLVTWSPDGLLGQEVVFDSLTMFVSFLLAARWVEMRVRHHAEREVEAALDQPPNPVRRITPNGHMETVMPSELRVGDRIRVPVGESFPADGLILAGATQVSESLMSGESVPQFRDAGQMVLEGSLNVGQPVDLRITGTGPATRQAELLRMAEGAALERGAVQVLADRWATPFLWAVLMLACGAAAVWWVFEPSRALWVFVAVLIVTCPCALSLSAPAAWIAAARGYARDGMLLRRLSAMEQLAVVDRVIFDKTGTLTDGRLAVLEAEVMEEGVGLDEAIELAGSLAAWSRHPVAQALQASRPGPSPLHLHWHDVVEEPGQGVEGRAPDGRRWRLGRPEWVQAFSRDRSLRPACADLHELSDKVRVALGHDGGVVLKLGLGDHLRTDAKPAVQALERLGPTVALLSGDRTERVLAAARMLGVGVMKAGALPGDKLKRLSDLQAQGHCVAMVGDGINDTPAMAKADVSIAMGQGSAHAVRRSDAVLLTSDLWAIPRAVVRSRLTLRLIRQNLIWAAAYNAAAVPLALSGHLPPWAAGAGMALSSLVVVVNAARAGGVVALPTEAPPIARP